MRNWDKYEVQHKEGTLECLDVILDINIRNIVTKCDVAGDRYVTSICNSG